MPKQPKMNQMESKLGLDGANQREGDTKWSTELRVEGLIRERETPGGPQNWEWSG